MSAELSLLWPCSHLGVAGSPEAPKLLARDQATAVSGLLPGRANGKPTLSREVLLTITFPLQGCPVLPQTPGSSVACSTGWAAPRPHLRLARRMQCSSTGAEMSGVAASTFIFSLHLPARSFPLLLPLKAKSKKC